MTPPPASASSSMTPQRTAAIVLSLVWAGAGHMALGMWRRGALCFGAMLLAGSAVSALWSALGAGASWLTLLCILLVSVGFRVGALLDVVRLPAVRDRAPSWARVLFGCLCFLAISEVWAFTNRRYVLEAFHIPSGGMIPTLQIGDHVMVDKLAYLRHAPERGDVVVFPFPKAPDKDFIKRIVAVPGDTVEIRKNVIYINGQPVPHQAPANAPPCNYDDRLDPDEGWVRRDCVAFEEMLGVHWFTVVHNYQVGSGRQLRSWSPLTVPLGQVFVMGDNRDSSHDSRYWGFVPIDTLKGRVFVIWYSWGPSGIRRERIVTAVE
jgi:signal peptidase I